MSFRTLARVHQCFLRHSCRCILSAAAVDPLLIRYNSTNANSNKKPSQANTQFPDSANLENSAPGPSTESSKRTEESCGERITGSDYNSTKYKGHSQRETSRTTSAAQGKESEKPIVGSNYDARGLVNEARRLLDIDLSAKKSEEIQETIQAAKEDGDQASSEDTDTDDRTKRVSPVKPALPTRSNFPEDMLQPLIVPPKGRAREWFTPFDFSKYLEPLYQRGWELGFQPITSASAVGHILSGRNFNFNSWDEMMKFLRGVDAISTEDFHHPHHMEIRNKGNYPNVTMSLISHTATIPLWVRPDVAEKRTNIPGVTLRDLRLAIRIEELYRDSFGGSSPKILPPAYRQPKIPVIKKLLNLKPKHLKSHCTSCGDLHPSASCTIDPYNADRFLPSCSKCHRRHAPMAKCPRGRDIYMTPPPTPCPNCGGNHWLQDCRKRQIPIEEAETMMIPLTSQMNLEN